MSDYLAAHQSPSKPSHSPPGLFVLDRAEVKYLENQIMKGPMFINTFYYHFALLKHHRLPSASQPASQQRYITRLSDYTGQDRTVAVDVVRKLVGV